MALKATSLRLTDQYRERMVALREGAQMEALRIWGKVDGRNLDATYQSKSLANSVAQMQREAVRLSGGYIHAFIEIERGERVGTPVVHRESIGEARNGDSLTKALESPMISVKARIKNGESVDKALEFGQQRLVRMVGLAVDTSTREALQSGMESSPHVDGYKRAVRGTCGACMAANKTSFYGLSVPMGIHPNCQCVTEPAVRSRHPREVFRERKIPADDQRLIDEWADNPDVAADCNCLLRGAAERQTGLSDKELRSLCDQMDHAIERAGPVLNSLHFWRGFGGLHPYEALEKTAEPLIEEVAVDDGIGTLVANEEQLGEEEEAYGATDAMLVAVDSRVKAIWNGNLEEILIRAGARYVTHGIMTTRPWRAASSVMPGVYPFLAKR